MKLIDTIHNIINEAYSEKLVNNMVQKYSISNRELDTRTIRNAIERFQQISPNLQNRDITKYSWEDLTNIIAAFQPKRIKAGKIDKTKTDANLIYHKDNIRVYLASNKTACIKYGHGYNFCISSRGLENKYETYGPERIGANIYFVFNDNLSNYSHTNEGGGREFKDPNHLLVVIPHYNSIPKVQYGITNAYNSGEDIVYYKPDIYSYYPWLKPLIQKGIIKPKDLKEEELFKLKRDEIEEEYEDDIIEYMAKGMIYVDSYKVKRKIGHLQDYLVRWFWSQDEFNKHFNSPPTGAESSTDRDMMSFCLKDPTLKPIIARILEIQKERDEKIKKLRIKILGK